MYLVNYSLIAPEIWLLFTTCVILIVDAFYKDKAKDLNFTLSLVALSGSAVFILQIPNGSYEKLFAGSFLIDPLACFLKLLVCGLSFIVLIYSKQYLLKQQLLKGEYFILMLLSILGMMILISSGNFIVMYLGLELLALPIYTLVAIKTNHTQAAEAAMKYFILGALSTGLMLYGISLVYGATGSFEFMDFVNIKTNPDVPRIAFLFGLAFVLSGVAFKLGAVPFHTWVPDVYHGAPISVTLFISSIPKVAAFAFIYRLLSQAFVSFISNWSTIVLAIALFSILLGNVVAISQTNIRRMLGYSAISHMGFVLLALVLSPDVGATYALFYIVTYSISAVGIFGVLVLLSNRNEEIQDICDLKNLHILNPGMAFSLLIFLFSLAGIPPLLGFYAKFVVIYSLVNVDMIAIAILTVLLSVIGCFYYLKVIKAIYFEQVERVTSDDSYEISLLSKLCVYGNGFLMLLIGIYPGPLLNICSNVLK